MRIALLAMPFLLPQFPSLGLTQIKARLKEIFGDQVEVSIFYLNHEFFKYFGSEWYYMINQDTTYTSISEWLFRQEAFDGVTPNFQEYLKRFYPQQPFSPAAAQKLMNLGRFIEELIDKYRLVDYRLVGLNATFTVVPGLAFCRHLKKRNAKILTAMGGACLYKDMGEAISRYYPHVDYVCSGPALTSFPRLISEIIEAHPNPGETIDGIFNHTNIGKVKNVGEELDINHPIALEYEDFLQAFYQSQLDQVSEPSILLETARGCYWSKCKFCGLNEDQLRYRMKKPETAINEIQYYLDHYDCHIQMVDNIMPRNYVKRVLPYLKVPEGRHILYEVRGDYNEEEMKILNQSNVKRIQPGIESLHTPIHEVMNKGVTAFQCINMLKLCIKYGILPSWNLMVGFPLMTAEMYEGLLAIIPLLSHLHPPEVLTPVRFDRYSAFWQDAEKYQLKLAPFSSYAFIYPYDQAFLDQIAYYFEDRNLTAQRVQLMGRYYMKIEKAINQWKSSWKGSDIERIPRLYPYEKDAQVYIYDSRSTPAAQYPLSSREKEILEILELPLNIEEIKTTLPQENHGDIVRALYRLEGKNLVFKEGDRYMSLVIQGYSPQEMAKTLAVGKH